MLIVYIGSLFVLPILCFEIEIKTRSIDVNKTTTAESVRFVNLDYTVICKFQPNGFDCDGRGWLEPQFYYDIKMQGCRSYSVGNCPYNLNTFKTLSDCQNTCRDVGTNFISESLTNKIFCRLQHDFGHCNGYNPRWYYDVTTHQCRGFSYSGCGGNSNRFLTQQSCVTTCSGSLGQQ